jgi:hypothetical protein
MLRYAREADALPATDELAATNLALPMSPLLQATRVQDVVAAIADCSSR